MVNSLPAVGKTRVDPQAGKIPLRKEMAAPSSILAWKIQWMEEAGRLQSMGSQRIPHNRVASLNEVGGLSFLPNRKSRRCWEVGGWVRCPFYLYGHEHLSLFLPGGLVASIPGIHLGYPGSFPAQGTKISLQDPETYCCLSKIKMVGRER